MGLLFQGGLGICNALLCWPFLLAMHYSDLEPFRLPSNREQWLQSVVLPCALDLLFTISLLCGITCQGSLFMSMGLVLVIPATFFADIVVFKKETAALINAYSVIGAVCIVGAFIVIHREQRRKDNEERTPRMK